MDRILRKLGIGGIALALSLLGFVGWVQAQPVTDVMLAADPGASWLHTNGNWAAHRYSTLTQLNPCVTCGCGRRTDPNSNSHLNRIPVIP